MNTARIDFTQPLDPAAPRLRHTFDTPSALLVAHALHEVRGVLQAVHAAVAEENARWNSDKLSVSGEYEYANFGKETLNFDNLETEATPKYNNIKIGVNYRF